MASRDDMSADEFADYGDRLYHERRDLERDVTPLWKTETVKKDKRRTKLSRPSAYRQGQMRAAKQGPCRLRGNPPLNNLHHVIPRSKGLVAWTESNLVPLCGSGTTGCHGLVEAHEYSYVIDVAGEGFLERRYGVRYERPGRVGEPTP